MATASSIAQDAIKYINEKNLSATQVADAIKKSGHIPLCRSVNSNKRVVGLGHCAFAANGSNYQLQKNLDNIAKDSVVVVFTHNIPENAVFGELLTRYILKTREALGIVVHGNLRDIPELINMDAPVWCYGYSPIGVINQPSIQFPHELQLELIEKYQGSVIVADESGVVAITNSIIDSFLLEKLELIWMREQLWQFCIESLNWSPFDVIVQRKYEFTYLDFPKPYSEYVNCLNERGHLIQS